MLEIEVDRLVLRALFQRVIRTRLATGQTWLNMIGTIRSPGYVPTTIFEEVRSSILQATPEAEY